ncbi:unnamed protein product [Fusarium venenatum]|uniref:Uncharacterized protein n=1 Tax=Fusarium venenatum TaxID=56646 RepID=A0A2L2TAU1_9HYPO|nr:LOW QUALITY PROTEIN: uncharacterized protein FVRRES_05883 [Fusarium venenatum]CEI61447.1 unnamed protein product [Fusarium venenatum]
MSRQEPKNHYERIDQHVMTHWNSAPNSTIETTPDKGLMLAQFVACHSYPSIFSTYELTKSILPYQNCQ